MWLNNLLVLMLLLLTDIATTLRDVQIRVPVSVKRGDNVNLFCQYDLEGDSLYSVKCYKGKREFFRFTPNETPSLKVFPVAGINVEIPVANRSYITVLSVEPSISGRYSCEVSADAPSFHTMIAHSQMEVVDVPLSKPIITELKKWYSLGDILKGNCTAQYSKPAANLTWFINNKPTLSSYVKHYKPIRDELRNLESSTIELLLVLTHQHFINGQLKVSCRANIYDLYDETVDKIIEEERVNALFPSKSPVGEQNYVQQHPYDQSTLSQYTSYSDNNNAHNQNDAQIQADMSSRSSTLKFIFNDQRHLISWKKFFIIGILLVLAQ